MSHNDGSRFETKKIAFELRKKNTSYREINKQIGVPKSTLSNWFKNESFSSDIKDLLVKKAQKNALIKLRLMAKANKEKWEKIHLSYREDARQLFSILNLNPLFGIGLAIYWGEGDKNLENGVLRVSNVDYRLLKIFIFFLISVCKVSPDKIRLWLLLYSDLDDIECKNYWSKMLNIPLDQFIKSQYIKGREKTKRLSHGVCCVQVYSRELKEKVFEWINIFFENFNHAGMV